MIDMDDKQKWYLYEQIKELIIDIHEFKEGREYDRFIRKLTDILKL